MTIKLSVLVLTVADRRESFNTLMSELDAQIRGRDDIETIAFYDNRKRTIGEARNVVLDAAQGEYIVFLDDDDSIRPDYIREIMRALGQNPDCVVFDVAWKEQDKVKFLIKYGKDYPLNWDGADKLNPPNQWCVWRTQVARLVRFPALSWAEDKGWYMNLQPLLKTEVRISRILMDYNYDGKKPKHLGEP